MTHLHGRTGRGERREADYVRKVDCDRLERFGYDTLATHQRVRHRPAQ
jgi:hypothetical protein